MKSRVHWLEQRYDRYDLFMVLLFGIWVGTIVTTLLAVVFS